MAKTYKTKWWRLVRPEGISDADWKAFKAVHGKNSPTGAYIFGDPPGTGALQDAANNKKMANHKDGHKINWKSDGIVSKDIKKRKGDITNKKVAEAPKAFYKKLSKTGHADPGFVKRQLRKNYYVVQYGPDGRAK